MSEQSHFTPNWRKARLALLQEALPVFRWAQLKTCAFRDTRNSLGRPTSVEVTGHGACAVTKPEPEEMLLSPSLTNA